MIHCLDILGPNQVAAIRCWGGSESEYQHLPSGTQVRLGNVFGTYQEFGPKYLLGTSYLVPSALHQVLGTPMEIVSSAKH